MIGNAPADSGLCGHQLVAGAMTHAYDRQRRASGKPKSIGKSRIRIGVFPEPGLISVHRGFLIGQLWFAYFQNIFQKPLGKQRVLNEERPDYVSTEKVVYPYSLFFRLGVQSHSPLSHK